MKNRALTSVCLLVTLVFILSMAACKVSPSENSQPSSVQSSDSKLPEKATITLWTLWVESSTSTNEVAYYKTLEKAKKDLPDITIQFDATENEAYKTKIKTAMAANEVPDVFFSFGAGFVKPFIDAGKVLPLNDYLSDIKDRQNAGANDYFTFNDKTYGLTIYQWVATLFCNKELFAENSIKIPDTYDELLTAAKAFRAKGIDPIAVGEKEKWPGMFWYNALALRTAGAQTCKTALSKDASFDQQAFIDAAAKLKELVDAKAFITGNMGLGYQESNAPFLQGKVPMVFQGDWMAGDIQSADSLVKDKIVAKPFPSLTGKTETEFIGGSVDGLCVSANTKNKEAAVKVVKYVAEGMAKELNAAGNGLPVWKVPEATGEINPLIKQIREMTKTGTNYVLAWDTILEGADADTHKNLVADVFGSQITPENFAKEMQKLNMK